MIDVYLFGDAHCMTHMEMVVEHSKCVTFCTHSTQDISMFNTLFYYELLIGHGLGKYLGVDQLGNQYLLFFRALSDSAS